MWLAKPGQPLGGALPTMAVGWLQLLLNLERRDSTAKIGKAKAA